MFQSRFGKIDEFGWWDLERILADAGTQFTLTEFKEKSKLADSVLCYQLQNIRKLADKSK